MATLNQRLTELLISLKVISKLEVGQRLKFGPKKVEIQDNTYYTSFVRTVSGDKRDDIIEGLTCTFDNVERLAQDYTQVPEILNYSGSNYDKKAIQSVILDLTRLKNELPHLYTNTDKGLHAVKQTYDDDPVCSSKVEGVIERVKIMNQSINNQIYGIKEKCEIGNEPSNKKKRSQKHKNKVKSNQDLTKQDSSPEISDSRSNSNVDQSSDDEEDSD